MLGPASPVHSWNIHLHLTPTQNRLPLTRTVFSTDGCNATNATDVPAAGATSAPDARADPDSSAHLYCKEGGRLDLWRSPALRGNRSNWTYVGPMFTTTRSSQGNQITKEFVTTGYFGFGGGGSTRVVTQNAEGANYWIGTQANGSTFEVDWADFGATGYGYVSNLALLSAFRRCLLPGIFTVDVSLFHPARTACG